MPTVTAIHREFRNDWSRSHYAYATASCGHAVDVVTLPHVMECVKCGALSDGSARCACGAWQCSYKVTRDPHNPADCVTQIGDEVECRSCNHYATALRNLRALDLSTVSHTRFNHGKVQVYRYDPSSPTGVSHLFGIEQTPEVSAILRGSLSPLSPTEAR